MKTIKDPVHGYVFVPGELLPLLDARPVQRLRYIRQLGFSHLVYPGANHTRFEHSLGTMHLARLLAERLALSQEECLLVTISALLHDIGHGPFSHATEPLLGEFCGRGHQRIHHLIVGDDLSGVLEGLGCDEGEVCAMVEGTHRLSGIIHGDLDVDRMDYLLRDAHYTGVPYGTVDAHRLIQSTALGDSGGLVLKESGISAAESLLIARTLMRPAVYFHHVSRISESMILSAALNHLESGDQDTEELLSFDDAGFIHALLSSGSPETREMVKRLFCRSLFKRALYTGRDLAGGYCLSQAPSLRKSRKIAGAIAERAGVDASHVLVDIPAFPSEMSMDVQVRGRHDLRELVEMSPLLRALNETRREQWRIGVYCPEEYRLVVEEAAIEELHIKRPTKQDRLIV